MNTRRRRQLSMLFAVLAVAALGGKVFKVYMRGEHMQSRVQPLPQP